MSRRGKRPVWAAGQVPVMARSLARSGRAEAARLDGLAGRARAVGRADLAATLEDNADSTRQAAWNLDTAALFWVSGDMARLAMDASQDVPALLPVDAPATTGLMVLAEHLPAWDTTTCGGLALRDGQRTDVPHTDPVPVDALCWHLASGPGGRGTVTIELMVRPHRLPLPLLGHQSPLLVPFTRLTSPAPARLDAQATALTPTGVAAASEHVGVLALLSATWVLMATPNLATATPAAPRPAGGSQAGRRSASDVTVIDVRPARRQRLEGQGAGTGRQLRTRHVVRGHWTHQPHGKGRAQRRLQWVDDYLRGPEGAPITTRPHVWAWRH